MPLDPRLAPVAASLLRIALGTMFLVHSLILKMIVLALPGTPRFFTTIGLPGWFADVVFAPEAVGGTLLILGVQARWVALGLVPIPAVCQSMLGDGRYALVPSRPIASFLPGVIQGERT